MTGGQPHLVCSRPPSRIPPRHGPVLLHDKWEVVILPEKRVLVAGRPKMSCVLFSELGLHNRLWPGWPTSRTVRVDYPTHYRQGRLNGVQMVLGPDPSFPLPELLAV